MKIIPTKQLLRLIVSDVRAEMTTIHGRHTVKFRLYVCTGSKCKMAQKRIVTSSLDPRLFPIFSGMRDGEIIVTREIRECILDTLFTLDLTDVDTREDSCLEPELLAQIETGFEVIEEDGKKVSLALTVTEEVFLAALPQGRIRIMKDGRLLFREHEKNEDEHQVHVMAIVRDQETPAQTTLAVPRHIMGPYRSREFHHLSLGGVPFKELRPENMNHFFADLE